MQMNCHVMLPLVFILLYMYVPEKNRAHNIIYDNAKRYVVNKITSPTATTGHIAHAM